MDPWKLPLIVAGIVVPIVAAFMLGRGRRVGVAVGALWRCWRCSSCRGAPAARGADRLGARRGRRRHVLIVATGAVEDPADVARIVARGGDRRRRAGRARCGCWSPARIGFLDRWASDVEAARHRAQQRLW